MASLSRLMELAAGVRDRIDRTAFDRSALALTVAFHQPEELLAWVHGEIAFQQYRGLLRGARGTLMSRSGNALDQSVLLASLINDAGYEARIVRGRLGETDAQELVRQMVERQAGLPPLDPDVADALLDLLDAGRAEATAFGGVGSDLTPAPLVLDDLAGRAASTADALVERVAARGAPELRSALPWLTEEAREYFWVEYRTSAGTPWTEAHPAFAGSHRPGSIERLEVLEGVVPSEYLHRLRIDVTIEQKIGDRLHTHLLVDGWERPVANLNGVPLTFANVPWSFGAWEDFARPLDHVLHNGVFVTTFQGEIASRLAFDTNGNTIPLAEAADAAAAMFQTLGGAFEGAAAALGGLGRPELADAEAAQDLVTLTAQWIDFTLIAPGGRASTFRRTVLDRIGPEFRAAGRTEVGGDRTTFLPLISTRTAMVATGDVPAAFALDRQLEVLAEHRDFLEELAGQATHYRPEAPFEAEGTVPLDAVRALTLFQLFDLALHGSDVAYRAEPSLVVVGESLLPAGDEVAVERHVDIANSTKRFFLVDGDDLLTDFDAAIRSGVWDTMVEGPFVDRGAIPVDRFNTVDHVERALAEGHELLVLSPADVTTADLPATFGAEAAAAISRDLAAGYLVFVPPASFRDGRGRTAWWRVHVETGATLGVVSDGRGGNLTQYLLLGIFVTGSGLLIALMVRTGIENQNCKARIRGQAGYDLQLRDPREYERQSLACNYGYILWSAVRSIDDELLLSKERCRRDFLLSTMGVCPQ